MHATVVPANAIGDMQMRSDVEDGMAIAAPASGATCRRPSCASTSASAEAERRGEGEDDGGAGHPDFDRPHRHAAPGNAASRAPPSALSTTTIQGGTFHMNSSRNAPAASAKSAPLVMPAVQTGS